MMNTCCFVALIAGQKKEDESLCSEVRMSY